MVNGTKKHSFSETIDGIINNCFAYAIFDTRRDSIDFFTSMKYCWLAPAVLCLVCIAYMKHRRMNTSNDRSINARVPAPVYFLDEQRNRALVCCGFGMLISLIVSIVDNGNFYNWHTDRSVTGKKELFTFESNTL